MTKREAVERLYPGVTVDYALPQDWLDQWAEKMHRRLWNMSFDRAYRFILGSFVWGYSKRSLFGEPFPLTMQAARILKLWEVW